MWPGANGNRRELDLAIERTIETQRAEIERLLPYVDAFRREEDRADKAERRIDDLEGALASIRDAKEPKDDRADDDADWRFCALEMKRVAEVVLRDVKRSAD